MTSSGVVAVVPMKPLVQAKSRLAEDLTPDQREALSRNLLRRVLRALVGRVPGLSKESNVDSVWVVGGDPDVSRIASEEGAAWSEDDGSDINDTLWRAFQRIFAARKAALYVPGDLPLLKTQDVYGMVRASGHLRNVTLAPARQGGGTNGILVLSDLPKPFRPQLGPDSFKRHLRQATGIGVSVAIYYSPGLGFDLDTNEDLRAYEYIEPGFLERITAP